MIARLAVLVALLVPAAALAAPHVVVSPASVRPGEAFVVTARELDAAPSAEVAGRALRFWRVRDGWRALAALPVEQSSGTLPIEVRWKGGQALALVEVKAPEWRTRTLTVEPRFSDPPAAQKKQIAEDRRAFAEAFSRALELPLFTGSFVPPRPSHITAPYGDRRTFNGQTKSQHYGTDYAGAVGAPITSTQAGVVRMARDCFASGLTVVVDHGAGVFSTYFHLSRIDVKQGERVKAGQLLGAVGATGRVTGPHLHFGVRIGDLYVDPESVLALDLADDLRAAAEDVGAASP